MQFYSRTNSKTWNAIEFIRLFWKHSASLPPLSLSHVRRERKRERDIHSLTGYFYFNLLVPYSWMRKIQCSIGAQISKINFIFRWFWRFWIFWCNALKSGEIFSIIRWHHRLRVCVCVRERSDIGKPKTMLIIAHQSPLNMIRVNGIVWSMVDALRRINTALT